MNTHKLQKDVVTGKVWGVVEGTPEGALTAAAGSVVTSLGTGAGLHTYFKATGSGNTGWTAVDLPATGPGAGALGGSSSVLRSVTLDAQGRVTAATSTDLGALSTGLVKVTTSTGALTTAVANTDYPHPSATYITQTATNAPGSAQALSALASGVALITTTTGVVSTFAVGSARIPFGSGTAGAITDSAAFTFSGTLLSVTLDDGTRNTPFQAWINTTGNDGGIKVYPTEDATGGWFAFGGDVTSGGIVPTTITTAVGGTRSPGVFGYDAEATVAGSKFYWRVAPGGTSQTLSEVMSVTGDGVVTLGVTGGKIGVMGATPVVRQTRGGTLTNNVTAGGTTDQIDDFTSLTVYATDAAAIHNDIYQLARAVRQHDVALRALGFET